MATIEGTPGADTIDVSSDDGTLNGTPQGSPITGIDSGDGYDDITVFNSTISGLIEGGSGGMDLTVFASTIGTIDTSAGASDITLLSSTVSNINTGNGAVTVDATNTDIGVIDTSVGDVTLNMNGGTLTGSFQGGGGSDSLTFNNATVQDSVTFDSSSGNDTLTFDDTTIGDNLFVQVAGGNNTINIVGDTSFGSSALFDANNAGVNQINLPNGTVLTIDGMGSYTVGTDTLPSGSNLHGSFALPNGSSASFTDFDNFGTTSAPVCFTEGTLIRTPLGEVPVENLAVGDLVTTVEGDAAPVLWIDVREMAFDDTQSKHCPVLIKAGALGPGSPARDLAVSPQHCLLMDVSMVAPALGTRTAFARAKFLTGLSGVRVMAGKKRTRYITFLLDRHQIVQGNGAWSESFYPGPMGLKTLTTAQRLEIEKVLPMRRDAPELGYGPRAARVLSRAETEHLVATLKKQKRRKPVIGDDGFVLLASGTQAEMPPSRQKPCSGLH